ncbi:patatin-like phospholipase family protein [Chitinophaga qingshengii]|uniref:Patatin-like phospholipase family protein n=1 Tax=Chitinophaga qingshengii TaxID=1569794 RepID=A0ABR7TJS8_9BACT|nr:patatin-like phospholipase family protein [Chitinophaga qingshengii]MBC9930725.1 patatin-like phospholipase family protein [Chitinophaga qingshengii]
MTKTALVLAGGGARCAFAIGVIKHIQQHHPDIRFDILCGTSAGSLIALLAAIGEDELIEKIFTTNVTQDYLSTNHAIQRLANNNLSLYNIIPLLHKVNAIVTEERYEQVMNSPRELYIATRSLQAGQTIYFSNREFNGNGYTVKKASDMYILRDAMVASFTQPAFMPPVDIIEPEQPLLQLIDGGGPLYAPVKLAIDRGATDIYVVLHTPVTQEEYFIQFKNLVDVLERTMDWTTINMSEGDIAVPAVYNHSLRYLEAIRQQLKAAGIPADTIDRCFNIPEAAPFKGKKILNLHVIRPDDPVDAGMSGLEFINRAIKTMIRAGELKAAKVLGSQVV